MKRFLRWFLISVVYLAPVHAGDFQQPPFEVTDPAATENFRQAFYGIAENSGMLQSFTISGSSTCIDAPTFCVNPVSHAVTFAGMTLPSGATNYIQTTATLQSGATFFASSGTASAFTASTVTANRVFLANGSALLPSLSFTNENDSGFYYTGNSGQFAVTNNGAITWTFDAAGGFTHQGGNGIINAGSGAVTAGSVSYSFDGDNDTGMYRAAANDLGLVAGASLIVEVTPTKVISAQPVLIPNGTAAVPTLAFGSDTGQDTGLYRVGENYLGVASGGGFSFGALNSQLLLSDGLVGTPGLAFDADGNTGIWRQNTDNMAFSAGGARIMDIATTFVRFLQDALPNAAGAQNLGNSVNYWNDLSYKTITDRGCLGWFDDGVEFNDGTKVNDLASWSKIKLHPTKKTVYGAPMLDYRTFPKVAYKRADYELFTSTGGKAGRAQFPRDENDDPYFYEVEISTRGETKRAMTLEELTPAERANAKKMAPQDGIEMTSMFSIMIGSFKEANARIETLEARVAALEADVAALKKDKAK
jgi:hypothetical protein